MISIFKGLNQFAKKWKWLDILAIFCARVLPYILVLVLIIFSIVVKSWQILFFPFLSALIARFIIDSSIYYFYKKTRPAYLKDINLLIPIPKNPSFPSSHASVFSAISFTVLYFNITLGVIFLALSVLIGIARVFCGVHWFRDILGGFASGIFSSLLVFYLINLI
jgi:undecaprenyl-diphosphatase